MRILGLNLLDKKPIYIALTAIFGIGIKTSKKLLKKIDISYTKKVQDLSKFEEDKIKDTLEKENLILESNLKREIKQNKERLISIQCFRGKRLLKGLPTRGQRSKTNSRTTRKIK